MMKCSPEAFAQCPTRKYCGESATDACFAEGSECDKFNQTVLSQPLTNAGRIRAMSDEELAALLMKAHDCTLHIPFCTNKPECDLDLGDIPEEKCMGCMLEWLQQPAEEPTP